MAAFNTGLPQGTPGSTPEAMESDFELLLGGADTSDEKAEGEGADDLEAESEEGEAEPEAEEEGQTEEESEEEGDGDSAETYTIKVDGKSEKVTLDELTKGYSRQADYTRKSQKLADDRKAAESEVAAVQQERARYAQILDVAEQRLMQSAPADRDWDKLRQEDPITFAAEWAQDQRLRQHNAVEYHKIQAEKQRLAQVQQIDQQKAMATHVEAERGKLLEAIPTWKNPEVAKAEMGALVTFGTSVGFTQDELEGVFDHRAVLVLHKAAQFDKIQKRQPAARKVIEQAKAKAVLTPGSVSTQSKGSSTIKSAFQRLGQSGKQSDAAALFEQMLG